MFDAKTVQGAIDAMADGDGTKALEILKALLVAAATGGSAPAAGTSPVTESAEPAPEQKEYAALARGLMTLSNRDTAGAALEWVKKLAADREAVDKDREALEASERRALVTELVQLKAEPSGLAWERDEKGNIPEGDARKPCKRLAAEPLASLRERVEALRPAQPANASKGGNNGEVRPPADAGGDADLRRLSDYERETAAKIKDETKRRDYVERRLSRLAPADA